MLLNRSGNKRITVSTQGQQQNYNQQKDDIYYKMS